MIHEHEHEHAHEHTHADGVTHSHRHGHFDHDHDHDHAGRDGTERGPQRDGAEVHERAPEPPGRSRPG